MVRFASGKSNQIDYGMKRAIDIAKPRVLWMKNEESCRDAQIGQVLQCGHKNQTWNHVPTHHLSVVFVQVR